MHLYVEAWCLASRPLPSTFVRHTKEEATTFYARSANARRHRQRRGRIIRVTHALHDTCTTSALAYQEGAQRADLGPIAASIHLWEAHNGGRDNLDVAAEAVGERAWPLPAGWLVARKKWATHGGVEKHKKMVALHQP